MLSRRRFVFKCEWRDAPFKCLMNLQYYNFILWPCSSFSGKEVRKFVRLTWTKIMSTNINFKYQRLHCWYLNQQELVLQAWSEATSQFEVASLIFLALFQQNFWGIQYMQPYNWKNNRVSLKMMNPENCKMKCIRK